MTGAAPHPISTELSAKTVSGLSALRAIRDPEPEQISALVEMLQREACGHSWRSYLRTAEAHSAVDHARALMARENTLRPTTLWCYIAETPSGLHPVAVATVADAIHADFPHEGYPVLARAYIAPDHRHSGLYEAILAHRIAACRLRLGERFRGVHIGASSPTIEHTIQRLESDLAFVYVGDEALPTGDGHWTVRDYVGLTPATHHTLTQADPSLAAFILHGADTHSWSSVRPSARRLQHPAVQEFCDLLDAIGLNE